MTKIKEEEQMEGPGPLTASGKQPMKRESQAETPLKPKKRQKVKQEDPVAAQMVKLAPVAPTAYTGPFPKLMRPSPEECRVNLMLPSCPRSVTVMPACAFLILVLTHCGTEHPV